MRPWQGGICTFNCSTVNFPKHLGQKTIDTIGGFELPVVLYEVDDDAFICFVGLVFLSPFTGLLFLALY